MSNIRSLALLTAVQRALPDATADDVMNMTLLQRRLAALNAGLDDGATDGEWTLVVQLLRARDIAPEPTNG